MPVEIDETRLGNLQTVATIADALLKNPKTRKQYLSAVKEAYPQIPIPEIDAAAPVLSQVSDLEKKMDAFIETVKKERDEDKTDRARRGIDRKVEEGRALLRSRMYTEEGIQKIEEMMATEGIADYNNAIKIHEFDNPPPAIGRPSRGNMFDIQEQKTGDDYIKKLFETGGKDESVVDAHISTVLSEARQGLGGMRR